MSKHFLDSGITALYLVRVLDGVEDVKLSVYEPEDPHRSVEVHDAHELWPEGGSLPCC